jgi:DNA (cytosine-5)-methyltransferase 1
VRIVDLFCGGGAAAVGYARAVAMLTGSMPEVVGVDIVEQPEYPYEFVLADALGFDLTGFDFAHASPPCQGYVGWQNIATARGATNDHPMLIGPVRDLLQAWGGPYVIENVENAGPHMHHPIKLCGSMFGLGVRRHRLFESNQLIMAPKGCQHTGNEVGVYGKLDGRRLFTRKDGTELRNPSSLEAAQRAMGIDWIHNWDTLKEAIPPAYTAYIGEQLLARAEVA